MSENQKGIYFLYKYRKLFIIALIIGGLSGLGITFLIPKKFMSTAIVYPYNSNTRDELIANPQFGYEVETEQLLQLLSSKSMRDRTIEKFELYNYYDIDTNKASWNSELTLKYIEDVQFLRSKYLSVVINVTMTDPVLAADIANFQVEEINRYRSSIFEENRTADFRFVESQFNESFKEVNTLKDSIYSVKNDDNSLIFNFLENLNNENYDPSEFVNDRKLEALIIDYRFAYDRYINLRTKYEQLKRALEEPIPSVYSIDKAMPSYKKVSPSFFINGLLGAIVFFVLVFTIRLIFDKLKAVQKNFN